ncbi:hypothetical protein HaLaN_27496, partial [Haematococcus lacustris]
MVQSQPQLGTVGPVPSQQLKERLRRRTKTATMLELLLAANHSADSASCQDRASRVGAPRPPSKLNDSTLYHTLMDDTPPAPAAQGWRAEAAAAQSCGPARDTLPVCVRDSQGPPAGQELTSTGSATSPRPAVDLPHTLPVPQASSPARLGGAGLLNASHHLSDPTQLPSGPAGPSRAPQEVQPLGWHQAVQVQRISDQDLYCSLDGAGAGPTEPSLREESGVQSHAMPRTPGPVQQGEPTVQPAGHGPGHPLADALPPGMVLFHQPGVENIQVTVK